MYIRDLLSRAKIRPDLPDGYIEQALQDAARWVARKTGVVRKTVYGSVDAGEYRIVLGDFMGASAGEFQVLRPTRVMYMPGLDRASTALGALTVAAPTIPLAGAVSEFAFYVATQDLGANDGVTTYPMVQGDVIQAVNGAWVVKEYYKYSVAKDLSSGRLYNAAMSPLNSVGYFGGYVVTKDELLLKPVPRNAVAVMIECSIVPNKEFDTVDFPVEAEDAILCAAKAQILQTPNKSGGGADVVRADKFQMRAEGEVSLVRAIAEGGYGDMEMAPPPHFGN